MISAELTIQTDHIDSANINGVMERSIVGRTTAILSITLELAYGEVDMAALTAVIHDGPHGGRAVGEDAMTLRRIADAIEGEARVVCDHDPEPRVRRKRTGVRDLDVG